MSDRGTEVVNQVGEVEGGRGRDELKGELRDLGRLDRGLGGRKGERQGGIGGLVSNVSVLNEGDSKHQGRTRKSV